MRLVFRRIICTAALIGIMVAVPLLTVQAQPVVFSIETGTGSDTVWYGSPAEVIFHVDPQGANVAALTFPLVFHFTNGNIIGPVMNDRELEVAPLCPRSMEWDPGLYWEPTDPDTLAFGWVNFSGTNSCLPLPGAVATLTFEPSDIGSFTIDTTLLPPAYHLSALDPSAQAFPVEWHSRMITVACPVLMGDITQDGRLTAADVVFLVGYIFKGGPEPYPFWQIVDVDCSGTVVVADVIHLIRYIFMSQPMPCACNTP